MTCRTIRVSTYVEDIAEDIAHTLSAEEAVSFVMQIDLEFNSTLFTGPLVKRLLNSIKAGLTGEEFKAFIAELGSAE